MSRAGRGVALAAGLALAAGALTVWGTKGLSFGPITGFLAPLIGCAGLAALALDARAANMRGHASNSVDLPSKDEP
ncbi:MAG: hypothetical protein AAF511_06705 [Pseudomonadota bacterium]